MDKLNIDENSNLHVNAEQLNKLKTLKKYLKNLGKAAVAFSSGVDSTFLLKVAADSLGDQVIALTASSGAFPKRELEETVEFCEREEIRHIICQTEELQIEGFAQNPENRCYICKKALFENFKKEALKLGIEHVIEGSNTDDLGDYRPGLLAIKELHIKSPLKDCDLSKADIRALSHYLGLSSWDKPSYACLASRFVYGESITKEKLSMVERAEELLMDLGFRQMRVRIHGTLARIEVTQDEFDKIMENATRNLIYEKLKEIGFSYVTLDLKGYRTGSMNETMKKEDGL